MTTPLYDEESSTKRPPASERAIKRLANVVVTDDMRNMDGNKMCAICFESHILGSFATRLPCQHIFCRDCIEQWLRKECSCPHCRYELPTSNPVFEASRKKRMRARPPRFTLGMLRLLRVGELTRLCETLEVDTRQCVDKNDLLRTLENSRKIKIIDKRSTSAAFVDDDAFDEDEKIAGERWTEERLRGVRAKKLKLMMKKFHLSPRGCVTKSEIIRKLVEAQNNALS